MTTFSTYLAASLLAVTFGWVPAESDKPNGRAAVSAASSSNERVSADGYDYLIKLSAEDLEALSDGRATNLVSELPTDVGPIRRVRVYVGEGPAPRRLTPRDEKSPQRIAAASTARTHRVAKPVAAKPVVPEWKDAARLIDRDSEQADGSEPDEGVSPTAQRRTAYQNPDPLNLRGLAEGFNEGVRPLTDAGRNAGEWVEGQARNLGEGTRRGAESLLRGTGEVLERVVDPNAGRAPQYDANGYPIEQQVAPPAIADDRNATQQTDYLQERQTPQGYAPQPTAADPYARQPTPTPATGQDPYDRSLSQGGSAQYGQGQYGQNQYDQNPTPATQYGQRGRAQSTPQQNSGGSGVFVERFAEETNDPYPSSTGQRQLTPVPRTDTRNTAARDDWGPFGEEPYTTRRETTAETGQGAGSSFPDLRPPQNGSAWSDDFASPTRPGASSPSTSGGFASDSSDFATPGAGAAGAPATNWNTAASGAQQAGVGGQFAGQGGQAVEAAIQSESRYFEKLLLVILGAATCFTWIAYIDVRNKYRSVLRNVPGSGYGHSPAV